MRAGAERVVLISWMWWKESGVSAYLEFVKERKQQVPRPSSQTAWEDKGQDQDASYLDSNRAEPHEDALENPDGGVVAVDQWCKHGAEQDDEDAEGSGGGVAQVCEFPIHQHVAYVVDCAWIRAVMEGDRRANILQVRATAREKICGEISDRVRVRDWAGVHGVASRR